MQVQHSTPSPWRLAWRQTWRDLRAGELRLLAFSVALAVAALCAVGFFADRLNQGLARGAGALLGGDAVIASDQPLPADFAEQAHALGLAVARSCAFPSMARASDERGGAAKLAAVKSVDAHYPLRGALRLSAQFKGAPEPGTVWVDPALLDALQLRLGDALLLGDARLRIAASIVAEPDRGVGFLSFAPRVMLNEDDLAATALIQPASRVSYRFAVAAPPGREAGLRRFVAWAQARIKTQGPRGVRLESLASGRPEAHQTLDRAEKFLNLVALLTALLTAVAVGIAARDFAQRHLDHCAMLRVLGLPQRVIAWQYLIEFMLVAGVASLIGMGLGWGAHRVFIWLLAGLLTADLPAAGLGPAALGLGVGITLLIGFGLPPVLQLARVPPVRVIRREAGALKPASWAVLIGGVLGFAALLLALSSDVTLGLVAVGGFAASVLLFALLSWLALQLLRRAVSAARAPAWLVLATRQLAARPAFAVLQVSALGIGLLALCLLVLLRTDLIAGWRQATPADAPNRFVINVQPDQSDAFQDRLRASGVTRFDWYPMIRGRLTAVNGRAVAPEELSDERARRLLQREFNLSHSATLPPHNQVTQGRWVSEEPNAASVEEGLAETLHLQLGDRLRFDIAGSDAEVRITSLRKVDWSSMHANFFVMFTRARMDDVPVTFMAAFRAPLAAGFDNALSRDFPNITAVDVSASISQIQGVLDQVVRAVEFLFGFALIAGLAVLFAAVSATRESRAHDFAVMRALGASATLLRRVQRAELLGVGALAGLLASLAAMGIGWALARYVFQFSWHFALWLPLAGSAAGALLAWAAGWWGLREVLRRPVVQTLRGSA